MAISDLTGTTWVFNASIPASSNLTYDLLFTSNDFEYTALELSDYQGGGWMRYCQYALEVEDLAYANGWENNAYKTIEITGGTDATNATLIAWLEANASQPSSQLFVDLSTLSGWGDLSVGSHVLTVAAKATGYRDSLLSAGASFVVSPQLPAKGDLIAINLDGTTRQYRVLQINNTVAELLAMFDVGTARFTDSGYSGTTDYSSEGNAVNRMCNVTWYNTLSAEAKNAIVDKTFVQDEWSWLKTSAQGYAMTYTKEETGEFVDTSHLYRQSDWSTSITRHCYALSVQDVIDYLVATTSMTASNTTLTRNNILTMFYNSTQSQYNPTPVLPKQPTGHFIWLRSSCNTYTSYAMSLNGLDGNMPEFCYDYILYVRPAFQLDLSQIAWSHVDQA